jgi:excisionase family DNA binding protein
MRRPPPNRPTGKVRIRRASARLNASRAILTPARVATELGVSLSTVYRWTAARKLRVVRLGTAVGIPVYTLDQSTRQRIRVADSEPRPARRPASRAMGPPSSGAAIPAEDATPWSSAYVSFERLHDVPDRCPRGDCQGALRPFGVGVVCSTCARVFVVREQLVRSIVPTISPR